MISVVAGPCMNECLNREPHTPTIREPGCVNASIPLLQHCAAFWSSTNCNRPNASAGVLPLAASALERRRPNVSVVSDRPLFSPRLRPQGRLDAYPYDVSPDGGRFLVNTFVDEPASMALTLVVNWTSLLEG